MLPYMMVALGLDTPIIDAIDIWFEPTIQYWWRYFLDRLSSCLKEPDLRWRPPGAQYVDDVGYLFVLGTRPNRPPKETYFQLKIKHGHDFFSVTYNKHTLRITDSRPIWRQYIDEAVSDIINARP